MKHIIEKINLNLLVNHWDLNKISEDLLTVEKTLASGGQGKVKLGRYYDMTCIVKVLHNLTTRDYSSEVSNVYKYRHPNIPKFLGVYDSDKYYGLVFEHADGMTLSKMIGLERQGTIKLTFLQKVDYMIQLASIIEFLHDHHLIHRDLKPGNIIIDHLGSLKLLDYGIAIPESKRYISLNSSDFSLTPTYIPPEVIEQTQDDSDNSDEDNDSSENSSTTSNKNNTAMSTKNINSTSGLSSNLMSFTSSTFTNVSQQAMNNNKLLVRDVFSRSSMRTPTNSTRTGTRLLTGGIYMNTTSSGFGSDRSSMMHTSQPYSKNENMEGKNMIKVTNKFDIWAFGLIMSEVMTHCRPWAKNDKDQISDFNINAYIIRKTPYIIPKMRNVSDPDSEKGMREVIKKCTDFNPETRPSIKEVKKDLIKLFKKEVLIEKSNKSFQKYRHIAKINSDISKELSGNATTNTTDNTTNTNPTNANKNPPSNTVIKGNKIIQRRILPKGEDNSNKQNNQQNKSTNLILLSNLKTQQLEPQLEIENSLMSGLKKIKITREQNMRIANEKNRVLEDKMRELTSRSDYKAVSSKEVSTSFKSYCYMTYDDFNANIIVYEYPKKELYVEKNILKKLFQDKIKYRNPYCLNFGEKLYMLGGLYLFNNNTTEEVEESVKQEINFSNPNMEVFTETFGCNYYPANICISYEPHKKELTLMPNLHYPRNNCSAIGFRGNIWVIGGQSKICEIIDIKKQDFWRNQNELLYEMQDPVLLNFNDTSIFAIQMPKDNTYDGESDYRIINAQIYYVKDSKWLDNTFKVQIDKKFIDFYYITGVFYHFSPYNGCTLFLFSNHKEIIDLEDDSNDKIEAILPFMMRFTVKEELIDDEYKVSFELEKCKEVIYQTNDTHSTGIKNPKDQVLYIHNSAEFYRFDHDMFYYHVNKNDKKIELKSLDKELNEIY